MKIWYVLVVMWCVATLVGCSGSTGVDGGLPGNDAGRTVPDGGGNGRDAGAVLDGGLTVDDGGLEHRPTSEACSASRPVGTPGSAAGCMADSECDAGTNGRCVTTMGGAIFNVCSYDECFDDTGCAGAPCHCRDSAHFGANVCLRGGCRVDSDCAPFVCAHSPALTTGGVSDSFHCTTVHDECAVEADCADAGEFVHCAYDPSGSRWRCLQMVFLP